MSVYRVSLTAAGPTEIVNPGATGKVVLLGLCITANGDTEVTLQDDTGTPVNYTGILCTNGGGAAWFNRDSSIMLGTGKKLMLLKSEGTVKIVGHIEYEVH